jgi:hypothetical protein
MNRFLPALFSLVALIMMPAFAKSAAADAEQPLRYDDGDVFMRLVIRSKDQLTAFYTGRGFPAPAIAEILKTCFITPIIKNKTLDTLWIEPDSWRFSVNGKPIKRIRRDYWKKVWHTIGLSLAHQSTFGWTLLPETRNLQLDESAGGSIAIPMQSKPFTLVAHFNTGPDKKGEAKIITFQDVSCEN